jgi:hypothetical protein
LFRAACRFFSDVEDPPFLLNSVWSIAHAPFIGCLSPMSITAYSVTACPTPCLLCLAPLATYRTPSICSTMTLVSMLQGSHPYPAPPCHVAHAGVFPSCGCRLISSACRHLTQFCCNCQRYANALILRLT